MNVLRAPGREPTGLMAHDGDARSLRSRGTRNSYVVRAVRAVAGVVLAAGP